MEDKSLDPDVLPRWAEFTPISEILTRVSAKAGFTLGAVKASVINTPGYLLFDNGFMFIWDATAKSLNVNTASGALFRGADTWIVPFSPDIVTWYAAEYDTYPSNSPIWGVPRAGQFVLLSSISITALSTFCSYFALCWKNL